jgi:hypothetical protein
LVAEVAEVAVGRVEEFDDLEVAFEERAAILQYEGGLPRKDAETIAAVQVPELLRARRIAS